MLGCECVGSVLYYKRSKLFVDGMEAPCVGFCFFCFYATSHNIGNRRTFFAHKSIPYAPISGVDTKNDLWIMYHGTKNFTPCCALYVVCRHVLVMLPQVRRFFVLFLPVLKRLLLVSTRLPLL